MGEDRQAKNQVGCQVECLNPIEFDDLSRNNDIKKLNPHRKKSKMTAISSMSVNGTFAPIMGLKAKLLRR